MTTQVMDLANFKTLKLDASFNPVGVIPAHEALVASMLGKVVVLETYDRLINSAHASWKLPAVIVMRRVIRKFAGGLPCCRKYIFARDEGCCQYCGAGLTMATGTLDHVVPKSRGGRWSWDNLVLACAKCNQHKGNRTPKEAHMKLLTRPKQMSYREYITMTDRKNRDIWGQYLR
jgi:hypothetical protein